VGTAEQIYVDPSALTALYVHQANRSQRVTKWRAGIKGALPVTHHGRVEVVNCISRARFTGDLDDKGWREALEDFDGEFVEGRLKQADLLWRAALNRAAEFSRRFTPSLGTRGADVLHVACAVELECSHFVTFDGRQRDLVMAVGLKVIPL